MVLVSEISYESQKELDKIYEEIKEKLYLDGVDQRISLSLYNKFYKEISFCEEIRRDPNNKELLQVRCTEVNCRKWFNPTNLEVANRIKCLKSLHSGETRFYCSEECKQVCNIFGRSLYPKGFKSDYNREVQSELRELVLERDNYECQKCGFSHSKGKGLECHHFDGINYEPLLSADIDECITFCKKCHKEAHSEDGCKFNDLKCKKID